MYSFLQGGAPPAFGSPQKQLQRQLPPDFVMAGAAWGCYPSAAALDGLLDWLNPKGAHMRSQSMFCRFCVVQRSASCFCCSALLEAPVLVH